MPEPVTQLLEQLEALVRLFAPGERGIHAQFQDHDVVELPKDLPAPATSRGASRRRRNPRSGGVLYPRDSKASWAVNVRPKNWGNKDKIWWGRIKSKKEAQRISDIVHYYLGSGSVHFIFPGRGINPPPFLNANLRFLNSREDRMQYVKDIAKGDEYQARRKELMESVKEMVKHLTSVVVTARHEVIGAVEAAPTCYNNRSQQPELAVEGSNFGECRLSPEIPELHPEDIDCMLSMVLDDAF